MRVSEEGIEGYLRWTSLDADGRPWFEGEFELPGLSFVTGSDEQTGKRLQQILESICILSPTFLLNQTCLSIETRLEFSRHWGLGSSSSLIYLLACWADVDPFPLLKRTFGGSGYDVAAAGQPGPFLYRTGNPPEITPCSFQPPFASQLYFIYLGQKQNSREGIARYRESRFREDGPVDTISSLTRSLLECRDLSSCDLLLREHESIVAGALEFPRAKDLYFPDYWGEVKSLGAWGGDFVLATSERPEEETRAYFNEKGFAVFFPYRTLIL